MIENQINRLERQFTLWKIILYYFSFRIFEYFPWQQVLVFTVFLCLDSLLFLSCKKSILGFVTSIFFVNGCIIIIQFSQFIFPLYAQGTNLTNIIDVKPLQILVYIIACNNVIDILLKI